MSQSRFAIYFVPPPGSRLATFGAAMLGYDCETGSDTPRLRLPEIGEAEAATMTRGPARYGFHATLKAPFALAPHCSAHELCQAVDSFASIHAPSKVERLAVGALGPFLALRPDGATEAVDKLASDCVEAFDGFRAPLGEDERRRRMAGDLSARQIEYLDRWGYPHVFDQHRFHMTLAGPIPDERREIWRAAVTAAYRDLENEDVLIDSIVLAQQDDRGGRFRVARRAQLKG